MTYLADLTLRLAEGAAKLPTEYRERSARFFKAAQQPDGGFAGRDGDSDLYYTGFATRGLAMLNDLEGDVAVSVRGFLHQRMNSKAQVVDLLSLIYSGILLELTAGVDVFSECPDQWREGLAAELEALRRDDGGYAKAAEGKKSSTYYTFLVLLCHQMIDIATPDPAAIVEFILSQHREDGGFVEIAPMRRSGTNPTAAAIGALKTLDQLSSDIATGVADFLAEMQTDEGGLRANTRIPVADLLSTFTGLLTLMDLNAEQLVDAAAVGKYAEALQDEDGGFHGADWDTGKDVEYTFYGLGTLALVSTQS